MTTRAAAAAETAEKILDAATHLFAENVIAEITLADIAERSGVTVQTILRRFGDKDGVFAEAISRLGAEILRQRGRAISNDLDDLLANLVEHYETHARLVLKMLAEELTTPAIQPALAFGRRYHRRWCETVFAATLEPLTGADKERRRAQLIAICDVRTWEVLRIRWVCRADKPRLRCARCSNPSSRRCETMATILAYTSPGLGHLFPISALLTELSRRGHKIHLRTLSTGVETGQRLGFVTDAIDPRIEAIVHDDWKAPNIRAALKMAIEVFCRRAVHEVGDFTDAVARVRPDAVIVDVNCWGALSAADAGDIPWLCFTPYTPFLKSRGVPPFGPGLKPMPGVLGRIRDAALRPLVMGILEKGNVAAAQQDSRGRRRIAGRVGGRICAAGAADAGGQRQTVRVSPDRLGGCGADDRPVRA